ncbi:efflux RND transporter periplasmic adaptor subunit [Thalassotalea profundi]|uniref:Hemolysin D n=1 Tax=Thalassotalea profundi TaxID=2036687 RepID=A0ABQ3ISB6_9GAMM|nr:efflux RND transporter periplasmic adaptor subunit [Thalassotalea profundi]GHE89745.1 hemolysin D [Thalassotalea profundi]
MSKLISYISLSIFAATAYIYSLQASAQQGRAANVNVAQVIQTTLSPVAWVSGSIVSRNNSAIASEVSGRLKSLAELGDTVVKGQVIATINDSSLKLVLNEEKALLASSKSKLTFEQSEIERKKSLVERQLISQTELDESISTFNIAQANYEAAMSKVALAEQNLNYSQLKAPFNGIVTQRLSNEGEYVTSGTAIIRLVETQNIEASVFAPLTSYLFVKARESLTIRSPLGQKQVPIKAIIPVSDNRSHLMEVRLDLSAVDWPIGLNIQAAVANGEKKSTLAIPRDAIVLRRNSTTVFRINNENIAEQVQVSLGLSEGELIEIMGEIKAGDKLVIRGAERLQPGQSVVIKDNNQLLISGKS